MSNLLGNIRGKKKGQCLIGVIQDVKVSIYEEMLTCFSDEYIRNYP